MTHSTQQQDTPKYYDLQVHGVGYVNRIREVPVKRGGSFWACDIAALHGAEDAIEYTRFDCRVSGSEAAKLIKRLNKAGQEQKKILIGFKLGDLYAESFVYQKGDRQGETGVSLKARLLYISWIKVDGENVYTAPKKDSSAAEMPANQEVNKDQEDNFTQEESIS
jgi:Protein of unknown function (DUF3577)